MKAKIVEKAIFILIVIIGTILVMFGIKFAYNSIRFSKDAILIEAQITAIETYKNDDGELSHRAYISYMFEKQEYADVPLGIYSSNMYEGKTVDVYIDAENPQYVVSKTRLWVESAMLIGMGIVFSMMGWIPIIRFIKKARKKQWLLQNGKILYGIVESIDWNTSYTVNGQHPYLIYCTYTDETDGTVHHFKSENLWYDPGVAFPLGSDIKIYVNRDDYSSYYVDAE